MRRLLEAALVTFLALGLGTAAGAATVNVTTVADEADGSCTDGDCSLRDAVSAALPGDTVSVPAGTYVLTLGPITIGKNLTIGGAAGPRTTILDGNNANRIFETTPGTTVALVGLTLSRGHATGDGGAVLSRGTLTLALCTVKDNTASGGGGGVAAADLLIDQSTFHGNVANFGGAVARIAVADHTLVNSTFSGNTAEDYGGAWSCGIDALGGTLDIVNSTFTGNQGLASLPDVLDFLCSSSVLHLTNTIIAGNGRDVDADCVTDGGTSSHVLGGDASCTFGGPGDLSNTDPLLGPLADNGSLTDTHALGVDSPALDAADSAVCAASPVNGVDQRDVSRPQGTGCDIGAFELEPGSCGPAPTGEVARWLGDGDAMDSIGSNDGTLVNGASFGPGLSGQAFVFDGVNDYVSVPDSPSLSVTTAFTLAAWINPVNPAASGIHTVMAKPRSLAGTGLALSLSPGAVGLGLNNGAANCVVGATVSLPAGQWTHIAATFGASTAKIYVNGVLAGTTACPFASIQNSAEPFVIGRELSTVGRYYQGAVDKVQVFDHALNTTEVRGLFDPDCDPNNTPAALCRNVTVSAGPSCTAGASIDNGSSDPDAGDTITLAQSPAGPYPLGQTSVTLTVTDNHGAASSCTGTVTVMDTTPPAIVCPAPIAVDGSLASNGATVPFTVSATDSCDASVSTVATPPSGSHFPFGTTTVSATATDDSGNSAQCSFTVTVRTPQGQIATLIDQIEALITGGTLAQNQANPLITKLESASGKLDGAQVGAACNQLGAFINQVNAYIGNGTLTVAQGQALIDGVKAAQASIPCPGTVTCPCWEETELLSVTAQNLFICRRNAFGDPNGVMIQNVRGSTPGVEGGFAAVPGGSCFNRDLPPFSLSVTQAQADVCVQQIRNRCTAIGTPIP